MPISQTPYPVRPRRPEDEIPPEDQILEPPEPPVGPEPGPAPVASTESTGLDSFISNLLNLPLPGLPGFQRRVDVLNEGITAQNDRLDRRAALERMLPALRERAGVLGRPDTSTPFNPGDLPQEPREPAPEPVRSFIQHLGLPALDRALRGAQGLANAAQFQANAAQGGLIASGLYEPGGAALGLHRLAGGGIVPEDVQRRELEKRRQTIPAEAQAAIQAQIEHDQPQTDEEYRLAVMRGAARYERERPDAGGEKLLYEAVFDPLNLVGLGLEQRLAEGVSNLARRAPALARDVAWSRPGVRLQRLGAEATDALRSERGAGRFPGFGEPPAGAGDEAGMVIGNNAEGHPVFEDAGGVRSYQGSDGAIVREPVQPIRTPQGVEQGPNRVTRSYLFRTTDEAGSTRPTPPPASEEPPGTAMQASMGMGEKPPQGELFGEFQGKDAQAAPLANPETLAAQEERRRAIAQGQQELPAARENAGGIMSTPGRQEATGQAIRQIVGKQPATATGSGDLVGSKTTATGPDPNVTYDFQYKVVPLDDLVTSHTDLLTENPDFPSELQPRDRGRAASKEQIGRIANTLNADALLVDVGALDRGPAIVGPDNIVESGNGRTMALRLARAERPDLFRQYQDRLKQMAQELGVDPASLANVKDPVLVRERLTEVNRSAFAGEANQSSSLQMSATETAKQDIGHISDEVLTNLAVNPDQSKLPHALAGAKPMYGYRGGNYQPTFEDDVDRALFIVRNGATKSRLDDQYMEWLRGQFPGVPDADLRGAGVRVRDQIKSLAADLYNNGRLTGTLDIPATGIGNELRDLRKMLEGGSGGSGGNGQPPAPPPATPDPGDDFVNEVASKVDEKIEAAGGPVDLSQTIDEAMQEAAAEAGLPAPTPPPAVGNAAPATPPAGAGGGGGRPPTPPPAAGGGAAPPPAGRPPRAPSGAGGTGRGSGGGAPGALAGVIEVIPGEDAARAALRKWDGKRNVGALEVQRWWEQGQSLLKSHGLGKASGKYQQLARGDAEDLLLALHGEGPVPARLQAVFDDLKLLRDQEEADMLAADPSFSNKMLAHPDYFPRLWRAPKQSQTGGGAMGARPGFLKPRIDATFKEMLDAGWEPLSWNPYDMMALRRIAGIEYRENRELVRKLARWGRAKAERSLTADEKTKWRVPQVGPAFEGRPVISRKSGRIVYTPRVAVENRIADVLENMVGLHPRMAVGGFNILPVIRRFSNGSKRAKLFASFFQHFDFLTRTGAVTFTPTAMLRGAPIRYPSLVLRLAHVNLSGAARGALRDRLLSTAPMVPGRGISLRMIAEEGWQVAGDTSILRRDIKGFLDGIGGGKGRLDRITRFMESGLFDGVYRESMAYALHEFIVPKLIRSHSTWNDRQIAGQAAREVNKMFSSLGDWQTVFENPAFRELSRDLVFSTNESEAWIRQFASALKGPNKSLWWEYGIGSLIFLAAMANVINLASTGQPLPPEAYLPVTLNDKYAWLPGGIGYNEHFLAPELPWKGRNGNKLYLDIVGQFDTVIRWLVNPPQAMASRLNVLPRAAMSQISGKDYYGRPIESGPGGLVGRFAQLAQDLYEPIGAGNLLEVGRQLSPEFGKVYPEKEGRIGVAGSAIQAAGVNVRAETTRALLDRAAKESGYLTPDGLRAEKWDQLEPHQQDELMATSPMIKDELAERRETAEGRGDQRAKAQGQLDDINKARLDQEQALADEFRLGDINGKQLRERYSDIQAEAAAKRSQVDADFTLFKKTGELPADPNKAALVEYYKAWQDARTPSGRLDFERLDESMARLQRDWTPEQQAYVGRNIKLTEHPPAIERLIEQKDTVQPYFLMRDFVGSQDKYKAMYEGWKRAGAREQADIEKGDLWKAFDRDVRQSRLDLRSRQPELDSALLDLGYVQTPIQDRAKKMPEPEVYPAPTRDRFGRKIASESYIRNEISKLSYGLASNQLSTPQKRDFSDWYRKLDAAAMADYKKTFAQLTYQGSQQLTVLRKVGNPPVSSLARGLDYEGFQNYLSGRPERQLQAAGGR